MAGCAQSHAAFIQPEGRDIISADSDTGGAPTFVQPPTNTYAISQVHAIVSPDFLEFFGISDLGIFFSLFGSLAIEVAYGLEVSTGQDSLVTTAEYAMWASNQCRTPGAYLVDFIPIRAQLYFFPSTLCFEFILL